MSGISYVMKATNWAVIACVLVLQLQIISQVIEAKHYGLPAAAAPSPYGDIMLEDNEQSYGNSFDERYRGKPYYNQQQQLAAGGNKYQNEHVAAAVAIGRRRMERQKADSQYMFESMQRINDRNWLATSNMVVEKQQQQNANYTKDVTEDAEEHKCKIWVP